MAVEQMAGSEADADTGVDELRDRYRPRRVKTLFVGESSPVPGTHFYQADSNLYRATREAFAVALGSDVVPLGEAFLRFFAARGCWLVDLADRPVNNMAARERATEVRAGIPRLGALLNETKPRNVVVIKRDIASAVEQAIAVASLKRPQVLGLRYPLRQWRAEYVRDLAEFVRNL